MVLVVLLSFLSCISRAGLNIFDRISLGLRQTSVSDVMIINTVLPAVGALLISAGFGFLHVTYMYIFSLEAFVFSAIVQFVAYIFAASLKRRNVEEVVVSSKASDFFIPAIYLLPIYQHQTITVADFVVAGTISAVCISFLLLVRTSDKLWMIPVVLAGQAAVSPFITPSIADTGVEGFLAFAFATLVWRSVFSILVRAPSGTLKALASIDLMFFCRAVLAIVTQTSFVIGISLGYPVVAWSILNLAGAFGVVFSRIVLRDNITVHFAITLIIIIGLTVLRSSLSLVDALETDDKSR